MTTRADMLAEMASDMDRSDTDAFTSKINAAIRHYQPRRFWFNESRSVTFNTTASVADYSFSTIGSEFYRIDGIFITIASDDIRELEPVDYETLEDDTSDDGEPDSFAYVAKGLRLSPPPDDVYSVRIVGHVKLAAPASDAETGNDWMDEAYDLIMSRAKAELYAHRYEDTDRAIVMQQAEASALQRLLDATFDKVATGRLEPTDF